MMKTRLPRTALAAIFPLVLLLFGSDGFAENIDPNNDDSQYAYGENVGWLNAEPLGDGGPGVEVADAKLTGYLWAENIGWVSLSCENTGSCGTVDYGVTNDGNGTLSGYAWGENVGWISFAPTGGGVIIDDSGNFQGWAWGENIGWIHFQNPSIPYKVQAAWAPAVFVDTDSDGIGDAVDNCPNTFNPDQADADGDGTGDVCDADGGTPPPDLDLDGIPNAQEQGPDSDSPDFDGNGDGIPDWQQCNATSFHTFTAEGSHYLTLEVPEDQCFESVRALRVFPPSLPSWVSLPFGYFGFHITGLPHGGCTTVTIYLDGEPPQTYYKYGPTPDHPVAHWYEFFDDGRTGAEIRDGTLMLHLCDGERGDHDLAADGRISDPGGPAAITAHPVLFFPAIANEGGDETGLGIISKQGYEVVGTILFYQESGEGAEEFITFPPSPFSEVIEGEIPFTLPAGGKITIAPDEIPSNAASAIVSADGNLVGYARFNSATGQRYALPGVVRLGSFISIPFAVTNGYWRSGIGLFNPADEEVTVTVVDDAGRTDAVTLGAKVQHFFWVTNTPNHIRASGNIAAVEVLENLDPAGDRAALLLGNPNRVELYVPSISFGAGDFTGVGLGSPHLDGGMVTALGYTASGVDEDVYLEVPPGHSKVAADVSGIFFPGTLWVKLTAVSNVPSPFGNSLAPLQGLAAYSEGGADKLGAVSLNNLKFRDGIVGIAGAAVSPTLSLLNPGATAATVSITAYEGDGAVSMIDELIIPAGGTLTALIDSLVGGIALSSGDYIRIQSDVDLYGFETVYADGRMELLPVLK